MDIGKENEIKEILEKLWLCATTDYKESDMDIAKALKELKKPRLRGLN